MGRPGKPWWWSARNRWASTVDGVRYTAPAALRRKDKHQAWEWHRSLLDRSTAVLGPQDRIGDLCEAFLEWDEGRVATGERDGKAHSVIACKLTRVCKTRLDGKAFGEARVTGLNPGHLDELVAAWAREGLSPGYRRELAAILKQVLSWATKPRGTKPPCLDRSPLQGTPLPRSERAQDRFAGRNEAATWLRWLWRQGLREFALLQRCLVHTGARPSELTRATWGDIRWPRPDSNDRLPVLVLREWKAARKTGRIRRVYLPGRLARMLARRARAIGDLDERIWSSPMGQEWTSSNLATYTARKRDEAIIDGIPIKAKGPDKLVNYRWRHTAASTLLMAGVPVATVAELLGTSVAMITRVYGHVLENHLSAAAQTLANRR